MYWNHAKRPKKQSNGFINKVIKQSHTIRSWACKHRPKCHSMAESWHVLLLFSKLQRSGWSVLSYRFQVEINKLYSIDLLGFLVAAAMFRPRLKSISSKVGQTIDDASKLFVMHVTDEPHIGPLWMLMLSHEIVKACTHNKCFVSWNDHLCCYAHVHWKLMNRFHNGSI